MNNPQKPVARQNGLVIQEMPDEILVFDLETNKAHCLNQTAAFVWKSCDGMNSVSEIARLFGNQSGKPVPEDLVWLAIDQLNDNNLLAEPVKADFNRQTRREVIKKIGLAAVIAIPLVSSFAAPTNVSAATCVNASNGTSCGAGAVCCGGLCCAGQTICTNPNACGPIPFPSKGSVTRGTVS